MTLLALGAPAAAPEEANCHRWHRDWNCTQLAFGGVVRHAQSTVVEEAGKCRPALEVIALPLSLCFEIRPAPDLNPITVNQTPYSRIGISSDFLREADRRARQKTLG